MLVLAQALRTLPSIQAELDAADDGAVRACPRAIDGCPALAETIERTLADLGGPRVIRPGHSRELDDLVDGDGRCPSWLAQLEQHERERTGIRSLKVGFNRVFGYYLEVTRPNLADRCRPITSGGNRWSPPSGS